MSSYCDPCDRWFKHWDAYRQHMSNSSSHNWCGNCEEDFDSWSDLREHWIESPNHAFCRQCDEHFDDDDDLLEHCFEEHHYCQRCDRFFRSDRGLHDHNRQVHHYCAECRRVFNSESNLRSHMNSSVHQPKDVPCAFQHLGCTNYFVSKSAMILHLENGRCTSGADRAMIDSFIRQKDRRNIITVPRRLLTDGGETRHWIATERSWNGDAYECVLCHKTFRALDDLNRHLASPRHQENMYRCPHKSCLQTFSTLSGLCQHIESEKCGVMKFRIVQESMDRLLGGMNRLRIQGESEVKP